MPTLNEPVEKRMESRTLHDDLAEIDREIARLIKSEDNHKDKGMLLLMQAINKNLTENTYATIRAAKGVEVVASKVDSHVTEFQKWKNTGFGAYKAGILAIGFIQVLLTVATSIVGWSVVNHLRENDADHSVVLQMSQQLNGTSERINYNDRRIDDLYNKLIDLQKFEDAREQNRNKK